MRQLAGGPRKKVRLPALVKEYLKRGQAHTLVESFPLYIVTPTQGSDGKVLEREEVPAFGRCTQ
jgi:hypothetical protein